MKYFISFCLIFVFVHVGAHEFSSSHVPDVSALYRIEEGLLPVLDTFISRREEYLRELEKVLQRTSALRKMSASEIGEYLANPLNQYFVVKRFVEDWGRLEDYVNSDSTSDDLISQVKKEQNQIPGKDELNKSLRDLEKSSGIDPEGYRVIL
ncbi:prolyl 4-hydroxylase subunit alpha-2-like [Montipora foliosa]|uniref:prolyl 4-hydroxylase subunit alpha-2-like n=1 Tax=Montipora foliosa TaxID=591990 RepID=UPI0035F10539